MGKVDELKKFCEENKIEVYELLTLARIYCEDTLFESKNESPSAKCLISINSAITDLLKERFW